MKQKKKEACAESHFGETCAIAIQYHIPGFIFTASRVFSLSVMS